jgi:hypothetical protein
MALIVVLVLIFIVGVKALSEKGAEMQYNESKNKRDFERNAWLAANTDKKLEEELRKYIAHPDNYEKVVAEISPVFKSLEQWAKKGDYILVLHESYMPTARKAKEHHEMVSRNRKVALDILLANRGKVSTDSAWWGYRAYLERDGYGADVLKKSQFELVKWIRDTLNKKGAHVELVCPLDRLSTYYWAGSQYFINEKVVPFSEDLLREYLYL